MQRAIIVGGGIGGLTTARALLRHGFKVTLLEKAAEFLPTTGAGFGFSPNGQICLEYLGLKDAMQPILHPFRHHRASSGRQLLYDGYHLDEIYKQTGYHLAGMLRAELVDVLVKSLGNNVHYNSKVVKIEQNASEVQVTLANGDKLEADIVVGADGINSSVAKAIEDKVDEPVYCGENIFYGVLDELPSFAERESLFQHYESGEYIHYPVGSKKFVWAHVYKGQAPPNKAEWSANTCEKSLNEFAATLSPNHPLHASKEVTPANQLLHFGMYYRRPKARWHKGRVVLLGDACHATLPYAGQGANQAIEDSVVLGDMLAKHKTPEAAFQEYYTKRFDRTRRIVTMSWYMGKVGHAEGPLAGPLRDSLLKYSLQSGLMLKAAMAEILDHCPVPLPKHTQ